MQTLALIRVCQSGRVAVLSGLTVGVILLSYSKAQGDVIYRETFGIVSGSVPGDQFAKVFDWQRFDSNGAEVTTTGTSSGVNYNMNGRPVDVANVNAGPNNDGSFGACAFGILYFGATPTPSLGFTTEYSFNPNNYVPGSIVFSFYEGNNTAPQSFRLLVRVGGLWYASTTTFLTPVVTLANFGAQAQLESLTFDPAAANWQQVNFDGDFILGGTPGTGTTVNSTAGAVSLGASPGAPLSGAITAFGVYGESGGGTGNRRIDTFQIDATPNVIGTAKSVTWTGIVNADWDSATTNWVAAGINTNYSQGDFVTFNDTGINTTINLSGLFLPGSLTVSNESVAYVLGGIGGLSGTNGLTKKGAAALTFLTANPYSGPTTISNGTVNVGDGGSTGTLGSGNVTNLGTLVFNRNNNLTVANKIFGSGSINQNGTATLTLTGASSYSGPTVVNAGTLVLNGINSGGGLLTNAPGTTLAGSGTNTGPVDVSGAITPGTSPGTFTSGALTFGIRSEGHF
jgi:autotransporter-associated beta strand protein